MNCSVCGRPIEQLWGRWYHVDHHTRIGPKYTHPATPEKAPAPIERKNDESL